MENLNNTQYFTVQKEPELQVRDVLEIVFRALSEKGYNPVNQIVDILCPEIRHILPVITMREV